jgi:hypothetical protein
LKLCLNTSFTARAKCLRSFCEFLLIGKLSCLLCHHQSEKSRREIDCYTLGDYGGCVFHMMGLAELGLRAIAKERGVESVGKHKPIEWGTWQDVFAAIEGQLKIVRQARVGPNQTISITSISGYPRIISDVKPERGHGLRETMMGRSQVRT